MHLNRQHIAQLISNRYSTRILVSGWDFGWFLKTIIEYDLEPLYKDQFDENNNH